MININQMNMQFYYIIFHIPKQYSFPKKNKIKDLKKSSNNITPKKSNEINIIVRKK